MKSKKLPLIIVAVILSIVALSSTSFPSIGFAPPVNYSSTNPYGVAVADMNGDSKTDFVVTNWSANTITVFLGNGDGTFTAQAPVSTGGVNAHPNSIAVGYFNNDSNLDLAVANGGGIRDVAIMLGNGSGGFSSVTSLNVSVGGYAFGDADIDYIVAGDFDNDGEIDLALSKNTGYPALTDHIKIMKGNGAGGFTALSSIDVGNYPGLGPSGIAIGYFNDDTNLDMAVTLYDSGTLKILLGNGSGGFTEAPGSPITVGTIPFRVVNADLNADGKADLIVTNYSSNTLTILLGNGDGTFTEAAGSPIATGTGPVGIIAAQMGADATVDLVVGNGGSSTFSVFEGNGNGTFQARQDFAAGAGTGFLQADDFDGDGKTDLAVGNSTANTVSIFLQGGCTVPSSGLISWWPADGNATDITGGNDGSLVNGATYAQGINGQAFSFDGVNDWVEVTGSAGDFGSSPFSVDFWMKSNNDGSGDPTFIMGKNHANGGLGWDIRLSNSMIRVVGINGWGFNITSDASATPNVWHHIALTSTDTTVNLYIDGVLKGTSPRSTISATANPFRIGYTTDFGSPPFNGLVDEARIFRRALDEAEVRAIYSAGSAGMCKSCFLPVNGLVSRWRGEENAYDWAGANNGSLQNGLGFGNGMLGQAFSFDGTDDYVDAGTDAVFNFNNGADDFTIEAWVNPSSMPAFAHGIVGKATYGSFSGWGFYYYGDGRLGFGGVGIWEFTSPSNTIVMSEWAHVGVTRSGGTYKLFKDGTEVASSAYGNLQTSSESLRIGRVYPHGTGDVQNYHGLIDEVEIFNRALSSAELASRYSCRPDTAPDAFAFTDVAGANKSTAYTSNAITVSGLNTATAITIVGGEYEINGSETWVTTAGTVVNRDRVKVRTTSSASYNAESTATVSIGTSSDVFSVTTGAPNVSVTPSSLSFGNVEQGATASVQEVTISNTGDLFLNVSLIDITGTDSGMFSVETGGADPCANLTPTIGPGSSCTVNVTFTPATAGGKTASLEITSDDPDTTTSTVSLTGTGIVPIINVTPSPHDFGNTAVGTTLNSQEFTISNDGSADLVVSDISITGGSDTFTLGTEPNGAALLTIAPGGNHKVSMTFSPGSAGAASATLRVSSNDPDTPDKDVSLSGTGYRNLSVAVQPADSGTITSSPAGITCGQGNTDCSENITVENQGVSLTATPATGWRFLRWEGDLSGSDNPGSVTMDGNKSVTGVFATDRTVCTDPLVCFTTIQAAIDAAGPGDVVNVPQGTYYENIVIDTGKELTISGGWNSDFTLRNTDPTKTVIDGDTDGDSLSDGSVIYISAGKDITFDNMTIMNGYAPFGGGILFWASADGQRLEVRNCIIRENGGGIVAYGPAAGTATVELKNTLIVDNATTNYSGLGATTLTPDSSLTVRLENCTISDNSALNGGGLMASADSGTIMIEIANSIIWGNRKSDLSAGDIFYNGLVTINVLNSNVGTIENGGSGSFTDFGGNISADPVFLNPAFLDYRLNGDSPAIDAADNASATGLATDIMGQARVTNGTVDMGAYEHQPTVATAIRLLSLNGGEIIDAGMPYDITWEAPATAQSFKVLYSMDNGLTWVKPKSTDPAVAGNIVTGQRHFRWEVPMQPKNKKKNKIKVIGYTGANATGTKVGADVSDLPFMLRAVSLVRPNGPEPLHYGESYLISWETTEKPAAAVSSVVLSYTTDGGLSWKAIATLPDNPGSHAWTVPTFTKAKAKCSVKVDLYSGTTKVGSDTSDSFFTVGP